MKTNLIIALLLACSTVFAQNTDEKFKIPKNKWVLGGSLNFNYSDSEQKPLRNQIADSEHKSTSLGINPDIGYSLNNNLVLGLKSGFSFGNQESFNSLGDTHENNFEKLSVAPYIRQYIPLGSKLAFNLEGGASFTKRWEDSTNNSSNDISKGDSSSLFVGITPGFSFTLSEKVLLYSNLGSIGYNYSARESSDVVKSESNLFSFNLFTTNLNFGVLVVL
ncbi:outer membrane beta-barrel protein [Tamlana crocina]